MAAAELPLSDTAPIRPWLSIIGIGEDGIAGLTETARRMISEAGTVYGGRRHLALAAPLVQGTALQWPSPLAAGVATIVAARGTPVCVLASGDPFLHGIGGVLSRHVPAAEMIVMPAPSAFSLAAARLGWALQDTALVSLHGRPLDLLRSHLQRGAHILALTSNEHGPADIAALLTATGFGASRLAVLETLGGQRERVRRTSAGAFALADIDALNVVAIEIVASAGARVLPRAPGLADALFAHDGQITKRDIRALTLSALAPQRGELLWDVGAGAGSVGIEWMLADSSLHTIAVESRLDRVARIRANAAAFGVPGLVVKVGEAPAALTGLPAPDAVFVGGGASDAGMLDAVSAALRPGGRLVVNAVTLRTEALLLDRYAAFGGDLVRIALSRAAPLAGVTAWQPARPVTQWCWVKP
ncbi:MAG TPA: precorrin-6y C5,15-methyltransferase (decarboxylating) subunit CbiE [Stellaceae bacterium]|jgi:precorrin-6Y C5,15-methyltransferase (decarboxylating)|nr:precorrin-6y C5,15-methyltransferase (decarboxylating) subunit CbiE [Stellaceae bacterium]